MKKPDILLFFSDQHSPRFSGYAGGPASTPVLKDICAKGVSFTEAYTPSPLCVPGRSCMILGQYAYHTGIYNNDGIISNTAMTFLHSLVNEGYETVLIGRMHFKGPDQRHGFTKRIGGDLTSTTLINDAGESFSRGEQAGSFSQDKCMNPLCIGGGTSQCLEYDEHIIQEALKYLGEKHEKPQCIVVGIYMPHFPYVAPAALYQKYIDMNIPIPENFTNVPNDLPTPLVNRLRPEVEADTVRRAQAAYCAMIEVVDTNIGRVRDKFRAYTAQNGSEGYFLYSSDHGDNCGERKMVAKKTPFDSSSKIPFMAEGPGIAAGKEITMPVSLVDIGAPICDMAGAQPPLNVDGISLLPVLRGAKPDSHRAVISESTEAVEGKTAPYIMIRKGDYKYICYMGYEDKAMLFNLKDDPKEANNIIKQRPDAVKDLLDSLPADYSLQKAFEANAGQLFVNSSMKNWMKMSDTVDVDELYRDYSEASGKYPEYR